MHDRTYAIIVSLVFLAAIPLNLILTAAVANAKPRPRRVVSSRAQTLHFKPVDTQPSQETVPHPIFAEPKSLPLYYLTVNQPPAPGPTHPPQMICVDAVDAVTADIKLPPHILPMAIDALNVDMSTPASGLNDPGVGMRSRSGSLEIA